MQVYCACGFKAVVPSKRVGHITCPQCRIRQLTQSVPVSACLWCGIEFSFDQKTCPNCKRERVVQQRARDNYKAPIPDPEPDPAPE